MNFCLAKLGCVASMVAIVVGEAKEEGVLGAEAEEHALKLHGPDPWWGV